MVLRVSLCFRCKIFSVRAHSHHIFLYERVITDISTKILHSFIKTTRFSIGVTVDVKWKKLQYTMNFYRFWRKSICLEIRRVKMRHTRTLSVAFINLLERFINHFENRLFSGNKNLIVFDLAGPTFNRGKAEHNALMESKMKTVKRDTRWFLGTAVCTCALWAFLPVFNPVRELPLKAWYPFDALKTPT